MLTDGQTDGRTLKRKILNGGYNIILSALFKVVGYKNQILTSIKGRNSVANLRKTKIYNTNLDLVTDNVYTNFGLILSIRSQDIEQKPNFDFNQGL